MIREKEMLIKEKEVENKAKEMENKAKEMENKAREIELMRFKAEADAEDRKKLTELLLKVVTPRE